MPPAAHDPAAHEPTAHEPAAHEPRTTVVHGLLLAAGAGRRMGTPKALLRHADGTPFVTRAVQALREGGCPRVTVVVGAAAGDVTALLDGTGTDVVLARDWAEGMGASLRAGLRHTTHSPADPLPEAVVVSLVDLPDVGPEVVARLLGRAGPAHGPFTRALVRAAYAGRPGHPVLLGRDHWAGVLRSAHGDRGARTYLAAHDHTVVECGDLATGRDTDTPADLP